MNWAGAGFGGTAWEVCFRELEHFVRRLRSVRADPGEPEEMLPDVGLPAGEQRAALQREAARRRWKAGAA